ncbi:flagellin N-terminal helical domain-containing protein [Yersinia enterocolitica]
MRISTQSQMSIMANVAATSMSVQQNLETQFRNKKRVNVASDDPIASRMFSQLESENLKLEQYEKNLMQVKNNIKMQETNFESASSLMKEIRNTLINSQVPSNSSDDIKIHAKNIESKMELLVEILNKKNIEGRYLYSGTKTADKPVTFNISSGKYEYHGNDTIREIIVGEGVTEKDGAQLHQAFSSGNDPVKVLSDVKDLYTTLKTGIISSTTLADIQTLMVAVEDVASKLDGISADFINRKEKLDVLQANQQQMKASNTQFGQSLVGMTDIEQGMLSLQIQQHSNLLNHSMKIHIKMSQLSIFNLMS